MKIHEILSEGNTGSLSADVADALPNTTVLTDMLNTDPYLQYRMGLAIAGARAKDQGLIPAFDEKSAWGENMVVTAYTPEDEETLQLALKDMPGLNAQRQISTPNSTEATDVYKQSPVQNRGAIRKLK